MPISITLYDPQTNEVKKTYSRLFVPWKILKAATRMQETVKDDQVTDPDALAGLVVEAFGNQFSIQDLNEGADIGEMLAVITAIVAKATSAMPANPTRPGNP